MVFLRWLDRAEFDAGAGKGDAGCVASANAPA
jgi:hypothetical protein